MLSIVQIGCASVLLATHGIAATLCPSAWLPQSLEQAEAPARPAPKAPSELGGGGAGTKETVQDVGKTPVLPVPPGALASARAGATKAEFSPIVREAEGVYGKRTVAAGKDLLLHGVGLCEWGIFGIDLYHCALYSERRMETAEQAVAGDQVLVIHLDFVRKLTAAQLGEAFTAATKVNVGEALATYQKALTALCAAMRDVAAGDTYTFVLAPQKGIEVRRNGERVTAIADEPFRVLFQRLYLGDKPPTQDLKTGMLGWKS